MGRWRAAPEGLRPADGPCEVGQAEVGPGQRPQRQEGDEEQAGDEDRPGDDVPGRRAMRGPAIESMNGNSSRAPITTGGITSDMISSGPSFKNWKRKRKYQSGRGIVTARGSAGASS